MKCRRFPLSWSSYSINLLLFPSPRGPLARVIKRDVITRRGGPLQLQPPRNSPSIRQQSRRRGGGRRGWEEKEGGKNGRGEGEKWRIKERRRYGPERRKIRRTERESGSGERQKREYEGGKREKEIERGKGVFLAGQRQIYHG